MPALTLPASDAATALDKEYRRMADAAARCAPVAEAFDAARYEPAAVAAARAMWTTRAVAEFRSASLFSDLATQLTEAGAGLAPIGIAMGMAQDEIRHAEIGMRAVVALGGERAAALPPDVQRLPRFPGKSPEERAIRNVIFGCCLSEIVNCARLVDFVDHTEDPFLRDATRQLLADEIIHAKFGFLYLEEQRPWLDANPDARASIDGYLRHAFASLERLLSGNAAPKKTLSADERALGMPDPARLPDTFYPTVTAAIVPGLDRLGLAATRAWKERRLEGPAPQPELA
jgi:hypothetical protein